MAKPNFFILGAPKCGTSSLVTWLSEHPNIFISPIKEPNFFNIDLPNPSRPRNLKEYEKLFDNVNSEHIAIGEASTSYMRSTAAIKEILTYSPDAKFIVCLRNPIEMAPSLHSQRLNDGIETEPSFKKAWELQKEREQGKNIPLLCHDVGLLMYGKTCLIGDQLEYILNRIDRQSIHIMLLEDVNTSPKSEYQAVLDFLEVPYDGRSSFERQNIRMYPKYYWVSKLHRILFRIKHALGIRTTTGIGKLLREWNNTASNQVDIAVERKELVNYFETDINKLSLLLDKDLTHWLS